MSDATEAKKKEAAEREAKEKEAAEREAKEKEAAEVERRRRAGLAAKREKSAHEKAIQCDRCKVMAPVTRTVSYAPFTLRYRKCPKCGDTFSTRQHVESKTEERRVG